jgi:hypothetical protein
MKWQTDDHNTCEGNGNRLLDEDRHRVPAMGGGPTRGDCIVAPGRSHPPEQKRVLAPSEFDWSVWHEATCTMNAAARRYKVVLDNGLWMTIEVRQKKGASFGDQRSARTVSARTVVVGNHRDPPNPCGNRIQYFLLVKSNEGDQRSRSSPTCHVQPTLASRDQEGSG